MVSMCPSSYGWTREVAKLERSLRFTQSDSRTLLKCSATHAPIKSKFQHPIWVLSVPWEYGIWFVRPSHGWGFNLCLGVVRKVFLFCFFVFFFLRAPKSLTAVNTCFDEMEFIKGRDIALALKFQFDRRITKYIHNRQTEAKHEPIVL